MTWSQWLQVPVIALRWEIMLWLLLFGLACISIYDFFWTRLVSNARAASHFARDNWKNIATVCVFVIVGAIALLGLLY